MADATIVRGRTHRVRDGYVYEGVASFPTTAATCTLPIKSASKVRNVFIQQLASPATGTLTRYVMVTGGATISATYVTTFTVPYAGTISALSLCVSTTVATHASNIWTVGLVNKTQTLTAVDASDVLNSNTVTTGIAFTAYTNNALTVSATAANVAVTANDVFELTLTKAASAANLVEPSLLLSVSTTGVFDEFVYGPSPSTTGSGFFDLTTGKITITRAGSNKTSALKFGFRVEFQ